MIKPIIAFLLVLGFVKLNAQLEIKFTSFKEKVEFNKILNHQAFDTFYMLAIARENDTQEIEKSKKRFYEDLGAQKKYSKINKTLKAFSTYFENRFAREMELDVRLSKTANAGAFDCYTYVGTCILMLNYLGVKWEVKESLYEPTKITATTNDQLYIFTYPTEKEKIWNDILINKNILLTQLIDLELLEKKEYTNNEFDQIFKQQIIADDNISIEKIIAYGYLNKAVNLSLKTKYAEAIQTTQIAKSIYKNNVIMAIQSNFIDNIFINNRDLLAGKKSINYFYNYFDCMDKKTIQNVLNQYCYEIRNDPNSGSDLNELKHFIKTNLENKLIDWTIKLINSNQLRYHIKPIYYSDYLSYFNYSDSIEVRILEKFEDLYFDSIDLKTFVQMEPLLNKLIFNNPKKVPVYKVSFLYQSFSLEKKEQKIILKDYIKIADLILKALNEVENYDEFSNTNSLLLIPNKLRNWSAYESALKFCEFLEAKKLISSRFVSHLEELKSSCEFKLNYYKKNPHLRKDSYPANVDYTSE